MNVPKLRFKEFSGEWEEKSLGKLGSFSKGGTLSKAELSDAGTECILYGELYTNYGEVANFVKSKTNVDEKLLTYSIKYDVVLPSSGETPEDISTATCLLKDNIALGGDLIVYRSDKLDGRFTSYLLNHKCKMKIAKIAQGKSVVHINSNALKKITVNYPNKDEQEKLVCFIRFIESKIENIQLQIECLEKQKKSLMQKIFRQELRFKDEDGKEFPVWEEKKLGEVGVLKNGIAKGKEFFGTGKKFINLQDVFGKTKLYFNDYGLVEVTDKELEENNLRKGDVLFVRSSVKPEGVGLSCVVMEDLLDTVFSGFIIRCRFSDTSIIDINYSTYCFLESNFRTELLKKSSSSANTNINQDNLANLRFKLPCIKEQQKIAEILSALDAKIELENQKLEHWQQIKKGLLQQMFV